MNKNDSYLTRRGFMKGLFVIGFAPVLFPFSAEGRMAALISKSKKFRGQYPSKIAIIGIGGAGGRVLGELEEKNITGIKRIAVNADSCYLDVIEADQKILIGSEITGGQGANGDVEIGRKAAEMSSQAIRSAVLNSRAVILIAGLGGGTGTGAGPVISRICKNMGIPSIAVVTEPPLFEGAKRIRNASIGLNELIRHSSAVVSLSYRHLKTGRIKFSEFFSKANAMLRDIVMDVINIIPADDSIAKTDHYFPRIPRIASHHDFIDGI